MIEIHSSRTFKSLDDIENCIKEMNGDVLSMYYVYSTISEKQKRYVIRMRNLTENGYIPMTRKNIK